MRLVMYFPEGKLQMFGCADVVAPVHAERFGRRAGELIARGASTSAARPSLRAHTAQTGTQEAMRDVKAIFAIPCLGIGVVFAIAAAGLLTNIDPRMQRYLLRSSGWVLFYSCRVSRA